MEKLTVIEATTINDAWHQCVFRVLEDGWSYTIDKGSYEGSKRYEFDFVYITIKHPERDMVVTFPEGTNIPPPCDRKQIDEYFANYLMNAKVSKNEQYTYGSRILEVVEDPFRSLLVLPPTLEETKRLSNIPKRTQLDVIIEEYKKYGYNSNRLCIDIGIPSDIILEHSPCLRIIDTRIKDNKLHFFVYFRSWDLWGGLPVNLGGLELLKQYMASEIGVENGILTAASKGLHLYSHSLDVAKLRRGQSV